MSKIGYHRLDGEEKSTLINSKKLIECFGIEYGKKFLDYTSKKFLDNSFKKDVSLSFIIEFDHFFKGL